MPSLHHVMKNKKVNVSKTFFYLANNTLKPHPVIPTWTFDRNRISCEKISRLTLLLPQRVRDALMKTFNFWTSCLQQKSFSHCNMTAMAIWGLLQSERASSQSPHTQPHSRLDSPLSLLPILRIERSRQTLLAYSGHNTVHQSMVVPGGQRAVPQFQMTTNFLPFGSQTCA